MKLLAGIFSTILICAVIIGVVLGMTFAVLHWTGSETAAMVAGVMLLIFATALLWNKALNKVAAETKSPLQK